MIELRREGWDPALDLAFQRALGPGAQRPTAPPAGLAVANPYKGLLPFEESDAGAFFGREGLTQELITTTSPRIGSWPSSARAVAGSRPLSGRV